MAEKKKKNNCGVENLFSHGYIKLQPIYDEPQHPLWCSSGDDDDDDDQLTQILPLPSCISTTAYVEPIGRKELAITWWENCPNQCMAHLPSNEPCLQFCKPLRKHVSILSKKMIATKLISNWNSERDNDNESCTTNGKHMRSYPKRILTNHPNAVQNQQSDLIHITPIHQSSGSSHTSSSLGETMRYYNLRIGKDRNQPWMQFYVFIDQPHSKFTASLTTIMRNTSSTPPAKRTLDFHAENQCKEKVYSVQAKRKRSSGRYSCLNNDGNSASQYDNMNRIVAASRPTLSERWNITNGPKTPNHWFHENNPHGDMRLLYHSEEESESAIETTIGNPVISTQQQQSDNTMANSTTPKDVSTRVPKVTPCTTVSSSKTAQVYNNEEFSNESIREHVSSKRILFPMNTFVLNKHCERLFPVDEFIEGNERMPSSSFWLDKCLVGNDDNHTKNGRDDKRHLSSEQDSDDGDSDEEQYATFLSLPIPESYAAPSSLQNDTESPLAPLNDNLRIDDTMEMGSPLKALEECPPRTKVFDLSYHDWKNLKIGPPPTSRFREAMMELILLKNELLNNKQESDATDRKPLWLPSLFNKETVLSPSWKFSN